MKACGVCESGVTSGIGSSPKASILIGFALYLSPPPPRILNWQREHGCWGVTLCCLTFSGQCLAWLLIGRLKEQFSVTVFQWIGWVFDKSSGILMEVTARSLVARAWPAKKLETFFRCYLHPDVWFGNQIGEGILHLLSMQYIRQLAIEFYVH